VLCEHGKWRHIRSPTTLQSEFFFGLSTLQASSHSSVVAQTCSDACLPA
jgi:hypothetical protein